MKRVLILVEGQTEESFIRDVLDPHFRKKNIFLIPIIIRTRRDSDGTTYKGGISSYRQITKDLNKLFGDTNAKCVTTMIDYYALPLDFPSIDTIPMHGLPYERARKLQQAFALNINRQRFIPFLVLHEFETFLFADVSKMADIFPDHDSLDALQKISHSFASPEDIDGGRNTHPSARIEVLFPEYKKVVYGAYIANEIGLGTIRAQCPHFDEWLTKLESI